PMTSLDPAFLAENEPLRLLLVTTFQLATLLSSESVELSISQLRWVGSLAQANPGTQDLALQAYSMANTLLAETRAAMANAILVPRLDNAVYAKEADACMEYLKDCKNKWDDLQNLQAGDKNWIEEAQASLQMQQNQQELANRLLQQA